MLRGKGAGAGRKSYPGPQISRYLGAADGLVVPELRFILVFYLRDFRTCAVCSGTCSRFYNKGFSLGDGQVQFLVQGSHLTHGQLLTMFYGYGNYGPDPRNGLVEFVTAKWPGFLLSPYHPDLVNYC